MKVLVCRTCQYHTLGLVEATKPVDDASTRLNVNGVIVPTVFTGSMASGRPDPKRDAFLNAHDHHILITQEAP